MTADPIVVDAGPVTAVHRLALAVQAVDALTQAPAGVRTRVLRETARQPSGGAGFHDHGGATFVMTHRPDAGADVVVRLSDPDRRYVPRRLTVRLWPLPVVQGIDQHPPTTSFVPATSRLLRPWLLPGSSVTLPRGTTALRCRLVRAGAPVRWARVELFTTTGRLGWGHGDERGEVVAVATERASYPAAGTTTFPAVLRVHVPAAPPAFDAEDPLADLVVEQLVRSTAPPGPTDLDNARLRGISAPPGYLTLADQVLTLATGEVSAAGDIPI